MCLVLSMPKGKEEEVGYILVSLSETIMNDFHNVGHTGVRYVSTQM